MLPAHQPTIILTSLLLSRTWWLLIFAASSRKNGADILAIFYPDKPWFYLGLTLGLIPLSRLLLPKIWERISISWQAGVFFALLTLDLTYHLQVLKLHHWQFHWASALYLWISALLLYLLIKALAHINQEAKKKSSINKKGSI